MKSFKEDELHVGVWAAKTPDRAAIIDAETGREFSFAEYEALSNQVARLARGLGLKPEDHAAVLLENRVEFLPVFWGLVRAGLRVTPIPTHLSVEEIDHILADSGAGLLLTSASHKDVAARLNLSGMSPAARLMLDDAAPGFVSLEAAIADLPATPMADQREGIDMLYSSGTTGQPKGVRKLMPSGDFGVAPAALAVTATRYGLDENTIYLHPSPLYHAAPLGYSVRIGRLGGCIVIMKKFDPEACLKAIETYRVTHSQWVPTHFIRLLRLPEDVRTKYDHSTLRCAIHAAAPCPQDVKRAMIDWWGPVIEEYYAGSEGNGQCNITSADWLKKPGSVGRAAVGKVHICDPEGRDLPAGEVGTIFFEGGAQFEYHNDPVKTAESRHPNGWSTIGDVGYLDEDGFLFLTDRKSFMIVSGGVNIYPQEVEALLLTHPQIDDAAVFGVPNDEFGEEVKAVIEVKPGVTADSALAADIIAFSRAHLSHVKCPRSVDFIDEMPRGDNGKLYKKVLRAPYWPDKKTATHSTAVPADVHKN
ncbi:acyl-CoA synthetase [Pseudooceanicola sp.]|uniref:acyl-CoA synthetase n=1 Tax=Pseudooceanicola sp. TaxID=1914328 RepID=UPI0026226155|nr:acyl-CoA synthetase [Pseudooceanicola sp.]MDF1856587.1 acyl-CoA synthetase [Pseudooceanicola sp.]